MWAFAVYDKETDMLFCSRDRFGVKPFYYYADGESFLFGSEIKELLEVMQKPIKADPEHVAAFLSMGLLDYDDGTMFRGIKQLRGGWNIIVDCEKLALSKERYYDLGRIQYNQFSKKQNEDAFRRLFLDAVSFRLRADVPVGSCLSGGLDSSAIVCAVHQLRRKEDQNDKGQSAVSSCFTDKRYDEQEYIDEVLKKTGIKGYKVFPDMERMFSVLDRMIWHMDEPFASTSIFAQWNVFEEAKRQGLTVMLDGQGADEQLAGYTPFYNVLFIELLKKGKWKTLKKEIKAYQRDRSSTEPMPFREIMMSLITSVLFPDALRYRLNLIYRKHVSGLPLPKWMYKCRAAQTVYRLYNKRNARQYIYAGMSVGLSSLLHYEDRNSMAHSIESRVPFLDYKLAELIYAVPLEHKIVNGRTKNLIREGLKDLLPEAVYNRISKLGFVTPEDQWLKENEELFYKEVENACDRLKDMIDKEQVLSWYRNHVQSTRRGDSTCFRIICCAHWADIFHVNMSMGA